MTEPETFPIDQLLADVQPLKLFNKQKNVSDLYKLTEDGVCILRLDVHRSQTFLSTPGPGILR
jgi:hypothetical protein